MSIDGHDATDMLAPCVLDFSYTDHASGKADELQLTLHDREGKWQGDWRPQKGMTVKATLTAHDWFKPGEDVPLPCGEFKIDEVEFSGPPDKVSIKAVSAALTAGLRDERKTRAWNATSLQKVAGQVAREHKLELLYEGGEHTFTRLDQRNESDITFISRVASEQGMACKVHDGKLCLYDSEQAEQENATLVIWRDARQSDEALPFTARGWSFREQSSGTSYDKAVVSYADPQTGTTHQAEVCRGNVPQKKAGEKKTLRIERRVESAGGAAKAGKAALRKKNEEESTSSIETMGNPRMVAGVTVDLKGFGIFSGKFLVKSATHKVSGSGGYTTSVELSRCNMTPDVRVVNVSDESIAQPPRPAQPEEPEPRAARNKLPIEAGALAQALGRWLLRANTMLQRVMYSAASDEIDKLMWCLPQIAAEQASNHRQNGNEDDAIGWSYLAIFLSTWLNYPENTDIAEGKHDHEISWDWAYRYQRVKDAYADFTKMEDVPYRVLNENAKNRLWELLAGQVCGNGTDFHRFDFISGDFAQFNAHHHNFYVVERGEVTDGLFACLGGFQLRVVAAGYVERVGEAMYRITVEKLAVYIYDEFSFNDDDYLGYWSCENMDYSRVFRSEYTQLSDGIFRAFREKNHTGHDFRVYSQPHVVDNFPGMSYTKPCPQSNS